MNRYSLLTISCALLSVPKAIQSVQLICSRYMHILANALTAVVDLHIYVCMGIPYMFCVVYSLKIVVE